MMPVMTASQQPHVSTDADELEAEIERLQEELTRAYRSIEYWRSEWEAARRDLFEEKAAHEATRRESTFG